MTPTLFAATRGSKSESRQIPFQFHKEDEE